MILKENKNFRKMFIVTEYAALILKKSQEKINHEKLPSMQR